MPLYEYQCDACGHRFEVIQKFSDAPVTECPKCGGTVQKLISSPAFHLKGSGWYATDYGKGSKDTGTKAKKDSHDAAAGDKDSSNEKSSSASDTKDTKDSKGVKDTSSTPAAKSTT
jgi:putative FmdB family regulatory protein